MSLRIGVNASRLYPTEDINGISLKLFARIAIEGGVRDFDDQLCGHRGWVFPTPAFAVWQGPVGQRFSRFVEPKAPERNVEAGPRLTAELRVEFVQDNGVRVAGNGHDKDLTVEQFVAVTRVGRDAAFEFEAAALGRGLLSGFSSV